MGRQVRLYFDGEDSFDFRQRALSAWDCILLNRKSQEPQPSEVRSAREIPIQSYFCLKKHLDLLVFTPSFQGLWSIGAAMENPLIEWWLMPERDGILQPGRLYYIPRIFIEEKSCEKDADFIKFAASLVAMAKKFATPRLETPWGKEYVGPNAKQRITSGDLSLTKKP